MNLIYLNEKQKAALEKLLSQPNLDIYLDSFMNEDEAKNLSSILSLVQMEEPKDKKPIEFDEFLLLEKRLDVRVGFVLSAEEVPKSSKLIKMEVTFGGDEEPRTIVTNIKPQLGEYWNEKLVGHQFQFLMNLKPTKIMGIESSGMIIPGELINGNPLLVNGTENEKVL